MLFCFFRYFCIDNKWQAFETVESGGAGFFIAEDEQEDICLEKAIGLLEYREKRRKLFRHSESSQNNFDILLYREDTINVTTEYKDDDLIIPERIQHNEHYKIKYDELSRNKNCFNGDVVTPVSVSIHGNDCHIVYAKSKYFDVLALANFYKFNPLKGYTLDFENQPTGSLGVDIALISNDGFFIHGKRSDTLGKWPGMFFVGFGEGVMKEDAGNIKNAVIRCLKEELNITVNENVISMFMLAIEKSFNSLTCYGLVDLRNQGIEFNADELLKEWKSATDSNENFELNMTKNITDFPNLVDAVPASYFFLKKLDKALNP